MSMIHILDGQENDILGVITAGNMLSNNHRKSLKDNLETFDFRTFADKEFSQHLGQHNRVIIPSEDKGFIEFIIWESSKYRDTEGLKYEVYSSASYLLLKKAAVIKPQTLSKQTASTATSHALDGTEWQSGIIEGSGFHTFHIEEHTNPYAFLRRIAKEFGLELNFRVETDGNRITGRYVDLLEQVGEWRGREVEFGKDLIGIRRTEKTGDIYTALLGLGPEREEGPRLEVFIEDYDALQRWGRPDRNGQLQHLVDVYEPESSDQDMSRERLTTLIELELAKRVNAVIEYETTIADLEHVPGMENKKIRFGDTIKIKDLKFNPPLYIEARVHTQDRDIIDKSNKHVELGDFIEYTEAEVKAIWQTMQEEIRKKLDKLVLASIVSSAGNVFKNGIGKTDLEVKTFLGGNEVDENGTRYGYHWFKYDKDGELVTNFNESKKTITITAASIDEKASYTVHIALGTEILTMEQVTISNVFDGDDGEDGVDGNDGVPGLPGPSGTDGQSLYTWVKYAVNASGGSMSDLPDGRSYVGFAYNKPTPVESINPADYEWAKIEGSQGSVGADGKTYYTWLKYATTPTSGMSDSPTGKIYMGIAYNKVNPTESTNYADYDWSLIKGDKGDAGTPGLDGLQGKDGSQGIPGIKGTDGRTPYTHIAYADNASGGGLSQSPTNKSYVGMYTDFIANDSTNPALYKWSLIKGADGAKGIPGAVGVDGRTPYLHIAYATNSTGTAGFSTTVSAGKTYIGQYTDYIQADSNTPSMYSWTLIKGDKGDAGPKGTDGPQGIPGVKGADGKTTYTWVKYANTPTSGMSDLPTGKTYIGFAYNKLTATESTVYADYEWAKFEGNQGVPGVPGSDGQPRYTWIKYAKDDKGSGMSDNAKDKRWLGLAHNKTTANESVNPADYTWSPLYDNVIVGGRNFAQNGFPYDTSHWYFSQANVSGSSSISEGELRITNDGNGWKQWQLQTSRGATALDEIMGDEIYTLSFEAKKLSSVVSGSLTISLRYNPSGTNPILASINVNELADKWVKFSATGTVPQSLLDSSSFSRIIAMYNGTGTVAFRKIQLEKGNIPTDWEAAPEDTDQAIDDVNTRVTTTVAEVEALDGQVKLKAAQTDLNKVTGRVEHAEAELKLLPGKLNLTVQKNGVVGAINATPELFLIDFAKVKITNELEAKHIKSLAGLNVNDQFVVDANGKVTIGNNRVTIDENGIQITRPDGAIAMTDGIMNSEYNVSSYDPHYMTMGESSVGGGNIFRAFDSSYGSWYSATKGILDGRGTTGTVGMNYKNVRDSLSAVVFQRYEFIHSARYLVFSYWNSSLSGKHSLHVLNGASADVADRIFFQLLEANHSGTVDCVIDLGKPTFRRRDVSFKIGWTNGWGSGDDRFRFRMLRVIQTDIL